LPILRKGKMVGRLDAKAWRKENRLQVIRIYLEPGVRLGASLVKDLASTLKTYAAWQGLQSVEIDWAQPDQLRNVLQGELSR